MPRLTARVIVVALLAFGAPLASAEPFTFVALGDTAYNGEPDYALYRRLIEEINARDPSFSIHVGDIWGAGLCDDAHFEEIGDWWDRYDHPLIYTPGDNEWTDCGATALGGFDPEERLQHIREIWFNAPESLGRAPMPVVQQGAISSDHARYLENLRFERENVLFVTVNIPGSHNGAATIEIERMVAFTERNEANGAWLQDAFRLAIDNDYAAVVVALHAEMFRWSSDWFTPWTRTIDALRTGADRFGKPVLVIHGDAHTFVIDRPLLEERGEQAAPLYANLTRLQVFGAPEIAAVQVGVDPDDPAVFSFRPIFVD